MDPYLESTIVLSDYSIGVGPGVPGTLSNLVTLTEPCEFIC